MNNLDPKTVSSFGDEWSRFDQSGMSEFEAQQIFYEYFSIFPWNLLPQNAEGFDMGCGSGRWARYVAPRVKHLHCIDPSEALSVAKKNLASLENITFHNSSVSMNCLSEKSQDFGYSLGVLHHVPDTQKAIDTCVQLLKTGAPLLLYLYYSFDNRPLWFRSLWRLTDLVRKLISHLPSQSKHVVTDIIALIIYWPLARFSLFLEKFGFPLGNFPLSYYRGHSFYTMRTDSRDRFGTPLENRFSKVQIERMMLKAGLSNIRFSNSAPYWCVVGIKA